MEFNELPIYTLTFKKYADYLYANVVADKDSYEISKAYWLDVITIVKVNNYTKLLVHENIKQTVNIEDLFQLCIEFKDMGLDTIKTAFVDDKLDQAESNELGLYIVKNSGIDAAIFPNLEEARDWLLN